MYVMGILTLHRVCVTGLVNMIRRSVKFATVLKPRKVIGFAPYAHISIKWCMTFVIHVHCRLQTVQAYWRIVVPYTATNLTMK